jgi:hypothetical protein
MCAPWLLPAAAALTSVASTSLQVGSTIAGANASAATSEEAKRAAKRNAFLAELYAREAEASGRRDTIPVRFRGAQIRGAQRAAYAQSGASVESGTAQSFYAHTEAMTEFDVNTVTNNAAREAFGFRTQGLEYLQRANQLDAAMKGNAQGAVLTGLGQGLAGAADLYRLGRQEGLIRYDKGTK